MRINIKRTIGLGLLAFLFLGLFLFLRSTGFSNYLKRAAFTEFEASTGFQLMADRVILNLFPLYLEAKEVKLLDEAGERALAAKSVKAYVSPGRLLARTIFIKRLVLNSPDASLTPERLNRIISLLKEKKEPGAFEVKVKTAEVRNGSIRYSDSARKISLASSALNAEAELKDKQELRILSAHLSLAFKEHPEIKAVIRKTSAELRKDVLRVERLTAEIDGSEVRIGEGSYSKEKGLQAKLDLDVSPGTFKRYFKLEGSGEGAIAVRGGFSLPPTLDIRAASFDAGVKGDFHLETLLELVRAGVDIKGLARVDGNIKGTVSGFTGSGEGRVRNGNVYGILLDDVRLNLGWRDGLLALRDMRASAYDGRASGEVFIPLPKAKTYTIKVDIEEISSQKFLLPALGIDLPVPPGRINGGFITSGSDFRPEGSFAYRSAGPISRMAEADFPGRIRSVTGQFALMERGLLDLANVVIKTPSTEILARNSIDLKQKRLDLFFSLSTNSIEDLTNPYYTAVSGRGRAQGTIKGLYKDPVTEANISLIDVKHGKYMMGSVSGNVRYAKDLLRVQGIDAKIDEETLAVKGEIAFPRAEKLFELKNPVYDLSVNVAGARIENLAEFVGAGLGTPFKPIPVKGRVSGSVNIKGASPIISGEARGTDIAYSGYGASRADVKFSYEGGLLKISEALLRKGKSTLRASGTLNKAKEFSFRAASDSLRLGEALPQKLPLDYTISIEASGKGTFKEPQIRASGNLIQGVFKNQRLPKGEYSATLSGKNLRAELDLAKRLTLEGAMTLAGDLPWQARVDIKSGRYDYLLGGFLKTLPEDLLVNLAGRGAFSGTKNNISGELALSQLTLAGFGQSFSGGRDARVLINNKALTLRNFSLSGGQGMINLSGGMVLGRSYDFDISGRSSLAPLKAFIKEVDLLTGNAQYVFHVGGAWRKPRLSGGLTVSEGTMGIKGLPQNIRVLSAYLYIDDDRLTLEEFTARMGGGNISLTGVLYLDGLRPRRFYFDTLASNVNMSVRGVNAILSGNLIFKGDPSGQSLLGEVNVRKAVYSKPVDWRGTAFGKKPAVRVQKGRLARTELRLRVYGTEAIEIKNNLARAPLNIDLTLRGTVDEPIPVGRVEAPKGKLFFRNTEFDIEQASVIFADPARINPVLNILATTIARGYKIRVSISGTLERFSLALTSEPPLDEMSILSLLTVGELGTAQGAQSGIGAAEATSFIAGELQGVVSERLRTITGVDRFQIDPYVSKTTGTITPRVVVGKRVLGDRLHVIYSAPVGTEEQDVIRLEYAVSDSVSLVGLRDERGSAGVDVTFRFEFR